jgi:hypothetical protein
MTEAPKGLLTSKELGMAVADRLRQSEKQPKAPRSEQSDRKQPHLRRPLMPPPTTAERVGREASHAVQHIKDELTTLEGQPPHHKGITCPDIFEGFPQSASLCFYPTDCISKDFSTACFFKGILLQVKGLILGGDSYNPQPDRRAKVELTAKGKIPTPSSSSCPPPSVPRRGCRFQGPTDMVDTQKTSTYI